MSALPEQLRVLRARRNLKQQDLAARAGVSVTFLSELENGKREPGLASAIALANALGVTLDELVFASRNNRSAEDIAREGLRHLAEGGAADLCDIDVETLCRAVLASVPPHTR